MSRAAKKGWIIFGIGSVVVALILFLIPTPIFDGEVTWNVASKSVTLKQRLSLSYFIGIGVEDQQLAYVDHFRLTAQGWLLAFIFILGLPGMIAYRFYLKDVLAKDKKPPLE